jgi:amidase
LNTVVQLFAFRDATMMNRFLISVGLIFSLFLAACSKDEPPPVPYDVEEVPLSQISADLYAVTSAYIERINAYDKNVNAVIMIASDALEQAAASDARRAAGQAWGPLDGIPILLKDNIDAVGMPTTAGSYAMLENFPVQDSEVAKRLRAAGAVLFGKANTSQWAGLRSTAAFAGSTVGGGTRNPYDLTRTAAGSSNGSGIASAASLAAATVGTDTTGSIMGPSSIMGLVGMRPSLALISRRGIVPVSLTQDTAGPLTRTVTGFAMMLNVMAGSDPGDSWSEEADANKSDYTAGLSTNALQGVRLGVFRNTSSVNEETLPLFEEALQVLAAQGAELVELPDDVLEDTSQEQRLIMYYDIKEDMAAYLANAPAAVKIRTLADIVEFNKTDPRESIHGQEHLDVALALEGGRQNPEYQKMLEYAQRRAGPEGYGKAFTEHNVSALVTVTRGPASVLQPDGTVRGGAALERPKGSRLPSISGNAALAGFPNLSVPMGDVGVLPVGLSFVGPKWSEKALISFGYAYEQASHKRTPPTAYKQSSTVH